jgi:hypothetical protein
MYADPKSHLLAVIPFKWFKKHPPARSKDSPERQQTPRPEQGLAIHLSLSPARCFWGVEIA